MSRSCPPTPPGSASATATTRARRRGPRRRSPAPAPRSATRRSCSPALRWTLHRKRSSGSTARGSVAEETTRRRSGRSRTSPCTPIAAVRCHPASREAWMRRRFTATDLDSLLGRAGRAQLGASVASSSSSTSSATFKAPNRVEYGLIPQSLCLTIAWPLKPAVGTDFEIEFGWASPAGQRQLAVHGDPAAVGTRLRFGRAERDLLPFQHIVVDRLVDACLIVLAQRLHSALALAHPQRPRVRAQRHDHGPRRLLHDIERRLPRGDVDREVVSGLGRRTGPFRHDRKGAVARAERVGSCRDWHAASLAELRNPSTILQ